MDVVVWLRSLGLGKYEAAFRENEIDETVLPSLTEQHLKQLGALPRVPWLKVTPAEHRRDISKKRRLRRKNPTRYQAERLAYTAPGEV